MSQTYFSKQDLPETLSRLSLLANTRGPLTVWVKGRKEKLQYPVSKFDKERMEVVLETKDAPFQDGDIVLCTFELRGMSFFSEVLFKESVGGYSVLYFKNPLYKSERRNSYRLLTYPIYEVWAEFDLGEAYEGGKVVDLKSGTSQTGLFKNFLKIVDSENSDSKEGALKIRVQDLSTTGMSLHIGELEAPYFKKDLTFQNVRIRFTDEVIEIPLSKIVYVVDYIASDRNLKKFKLGVHFEDLSPLIDDRLGKKINKLLRENDQNKDFENFLK